MEISDWISLGSFIIAALALIYSWYTGRQIHKLDLIIKKKEIEKRRTEEEESQKASIECNVIKTSKGEMNILKIYNKGQAKAYNVNFAILDDPEENISLNMPDNYLPYPILLPQQSFEVRYILFRRRPHFTIKIEWDDDFKKGRNQTQIIDL